MWGGRQHPVFCRLETEYWAIERSPTIVEKLKQRFPQFASLILIHDFTTKPPAGLGRFRLVVDRCSITTNSEEAVIRAIDSAFETLESGGLFIGIDWFSTHSAFGLGRAVDAFTRGSIEIGHLAHVGKMHFSDRAHLERVFSRSSRAAYKMTCDDHNLL